MFRINNNNNNKKENLVVKQQQPPYFGLIKIKDVFAGMATLVSPT